MEMQLTLKSLPLEICNEDDPYFDSFPKGYRFKPNDEEIIVHYLQPKVQNKPLPRNRIKEVEFYKYNPATLAASCRPQEEKEWYFFTLRDRKYAKGQHPNRVVNDGHWKATSGDKAIKFQGQIVGYKKVLVFFKGKPPNDEKTNWIMHEYRVDNPITQKKTSNDIWLNDWVLCKFYHNSPKNKKYPKQNPENSTVLPPNQEISNGEVDEILSGISLDEMHQILGNMI